MSGALDVADLLAQGAKGKFEYTPTAPPTTTTGAPPEQLDVAALLQAGSKGKFNYTPAAPEHAQASWLSVPADALGQVAGMIVDPVLKVGQDVNSIIHGNMPWNAPVSEWAGNRTGPAQAASEALVPGERNIPQKLAASGLSMAAMGPVMAGSGSGGAAGLAQAALRQAPMNFLSGAGGEAGGEAGGAIGGAPGQFVGQLVGGMAAPGIAAGAREAYNAGTGALGRAGIGPKQDIAGERVTESQAVSLGQKAQDILGPEGRAELERVGQNEARAQALEKTLADPNKSEADRVAAQRELNTIGVDRENVVPPPVDEAGKTLPSNLTVAQIVPTEKTVALDRDMRTLNNAQYATRDANQNAAMTQALQGMAPGQLGPQATKDFLHNQLNVIDSDVRQATGKLGGTAEPEYYGEKIQGALSDAEKARKTAESGIQEAIDPERKLVLDPTPAKEAAAAVKAEFSPKDWSDVDPKLKQWVDKLSGYGPGEPFWRFRQNWSDLSADLRTMKNQGLDPSSNTARLLTQLKNGMRTAVQAAGETAVDNDIGVARRITELGRDNGGPVAGGGSGQGAGPGAALGEDQLPGAGGPERNPQGGPGGQQSAGPMAPEEATTHLPGDLTELERSIYGDLAPRSPPPSAPLTPNITAEKAAEIKAANTSYADYKDTYRAGSVGKVIRPAPNGVDFKVASGNVPREFINGSPVEASRVRDYIKAVGSEPEAMAHMRDALVNDLHQRKVIQDGLVDPKKFSDWVGKHGRVIDMLPGLRDELSSVDRAQRGLDNMISQNVAALRDSQYGTLEKIIKQEPDNAIGSVLSSSNPAAATRELYTAVKDNPDALAGLRRGMVNYLDRRFNVDIDALEKGSTIKAKAYRDFMDAPGVRNAYKIVFDGQGYQNIDRVEAMLNRQAQARQKEATAGSNSIQKAVGAVKHGAGGGNQTLFAILWEHVAEHSAKVLGLGHGMIGTMAPIAGIAGSMYVNALKQAGITTRNALTREMMLNPELTRALMQKADAAAANSIPMQRRIAAALQSTILNQATPKENKQ